MGSGYQGYAYRHPHIHLIVTGGGLSLDGKRWIETDPKFLMHHGGLKKRWKYQVTTRMKKAHRQGQWHFPKSKGFLKQYPCFAAMVNKLWNLTWYAYIGASLADPRFSVQYIGQEDTGLLEYWNVGILSNPKLPLFHHSGFSLQSMEEAILEPGTYCLKPI